jgi:2-polyprenyl-3-methyl-5-hydroxy-6-metoxy-1,4-benzoquinol methylase
MTDKNFDSTRYDGQTKDNDKRQYFYGFDYDVMHPFMMRSFLPHFKNGNVLELGSYKGEFTTRLLNHFDEIDCVEASAEAIAQAQKTLPNHIGFYHDVFENVQLQKRYDNIIMTHVLEHVEDPVAVLTRIRKEWLSEDGRLFLVCPNANAPSRQIAVKMGLISHNQAVTEGEKLHGHYRTYALDTLEREAKQAGLNVILRTGIFFKALANFQFDRLLQTDIISKEYLEGCYQLGHVYPDLCASIFLLCEKPK